MVDRTDGRQYRTGGRQDRAILLSLPRYILYLVGYAEVSAVLLLPLLYILE